jgi:hypothetical protein
MLDETVYKAGFFFWEKGHKQIAGLFFRLYLRLINAQLIFEYKGE